MKLFWGCWLELGVTPDLQALGTDMSWGLEEELGGGVNSPFPVPTPQTLVARASAVGVYHCTSHEHAAARESFSIA